MNFRLDAIYLAPLPNGTSIYITTVNDLIYVSGRGLVDWANSEGLRKVYKTDIRLVG